jgi:hypothetical protein
MSVIIKEAIAKEGAEKKMVLLKPIVIPAGTVFSKAPVKSERIGDGHYSHVFGLSPDTSGDVCYFIDPEDSAMAEFFAEVKEQ